MRRVHAIAVAALGCALLSAPTGHAQGEPLIGSVCGFAATYDPGFVNQDPSHPYYGEIDGGPLVVADLGDAFPVTIPPAVPPTVPQQPPHASSGTLECWIQLSPNYNYAVADYGYSTRLAGASTTGTGILLIPVKAITYGADVTADQYLCSAVLNVDGDVTNDWVYDENYVDPETGQKTGNLVQADATHPAACAFAVRIG